MADESPAAAAAVYMAVTVVGSVVLALPGIAFAVLSGVLFGPVLGTIYCLAAATLGAMAAFLAGRYFLKDSIKPAISRNPQLKKWLFDSAGNRTLVVLMVTSWFRCFLITCKTLLMGSRISPFGSIPSGPLFLCFRERPCTPLERRGLRTGRGGAFIWEALFCLPPPRWELACI